MMHLFSSLFNRLAWALRCTSVKRWGHALSCTAVAWSTHPIEKSSSPLIHSLTSYN
jgi:hypothetical protein